MYNNDSRCIGIYSFNDILYILDHLKFTYIMKMCEVILKICFHNTVFFFTKNQSDIMYLQLIYKQQCQIIRISLFLHASSSKLYN